MFELHMAWQVPRVQKVEGLSLIWCDRFKEAEQPHLHCTAPRFCALQTPAAHRLACILTPTPIPKSVSHLRPSCPSTHSSLQAAALSLARPPMPFKLCMHSPLQTQGISHVPPARPCPAWSPLQAAALPSQTVPPGEASRVCRGPCDPCRFMPVVAPHILTLSLGRLPILLPDIRLPDPLARQPGPQLCLILSLPGALQVQLLLSRAAPCTTLLPGLARRLRKDRSPCMSLAPGGVLQARLVWTAVLLPKPRALCLGTANTQLAQVEHVWLQEACLRLGTPHHGWNLAADVTPRQCCF